MDMQKDKKRSEMKAVLESLDHDYMADSDRRICEHILHSNLYIDAQTIFTFYPMGNEADISPVISHSLSTGKRLCIPKCFKSGKMEAREIKDLSDITYGYKGIPEAKDHCQAVDPDQLDLVIVPCLAGNYKGNRLGYGGGYYDRYLANYKGATLLVFREKQKDKKIPVESHDIPTGYYVTESDINPSSF